MTINCFLNRLFCLTPRYLIIFLAPVIFFSCATPKATQYFKTLQKDTTLTGFITSDLESKIRKGDNLGITISSLSKEEDIKFNSAGLIVTEKGTVPTYMVQQDGTIRLHRFGDVKAEGLTRNQFARKLQSDLLPYLKEPVVNVTYLNRKVTILGDVLNPQVINMPEEQLSVLDAIAMSGDMKENARKDNILIIREEGNEKKIKRINLQDHSIFSSPWYYVQPNDIVVVYPDTEKRDLEEKRRNVQTSVALAASGISLLIIILDRVIK